MSKLALDQLRIETFAVSALQPLAPGGESYPDCPTATGCTCVEACQSIVGGCTAGPATATA
jgi:hypothetical protein